MLHAARFTAALMDTITDPVVRGLPLTGAIDQFVDSTDALAHRARSRRLASTVHSPRSQHRHSGSGQEIGD